MKKRAEQKPDVMRVVLLAAFGFGQELIQRVGELVGRQRAGNQPALIVVDDYKCGRALDKLGGASIRIIVLHLLQGWLRRPDLNL